MKIFKDLFYTKNNVGLDIARVSAFLGVIGYLVGTGLSVYSSGDMDYTAWGTGWAAVCGGNAAWIFARQKYEQEDKQ